MKSIPLKIVLVVTLAVFVWSGINPVDRFTWFLEVLPALVVFAILVATRNRFRFSDFSYILICLHAMILMIGGHTTYAGMPLFNWIRDNFGLARNYYDRVGHFAQGFVPALVAREYFLRKNIINGRGWQFFLIISTVLGFSTFYEFFEWWMSLASGQAADAFLATQGDVWDTQWDMFMCLIGSVVALATLSRLQDRVLQKMKGKIGIT
jgi:putative membrane protein